MKQFNDGYATEEDIVEFVGNLYDLLERQEGIEVAAVEDAEGAVENQLCVTFIDGIQMLITTEIA